MLTAIAAIMITREVKGKRIMSTQGHLPVVCVNVHEESSAVRRSYFIVRSSVPIVQQKTVIRHVLLLVIVSNM